MELTEERIKKLEAVIKNVKGDIVLFIDHMDPDSFGAAPAMAAMVERIKPESAKIKTYYCGEVGRLQNQLIFEKYHLQKMMSPVNEMDFLGENDIVVLLDSPTVQNSRIEKEVREKIGQKVRVIIDHHEKVETEEGNDQFFWQDEVGAVCTQLVELARKEPFKIDFSEEGNAFLAELLILGIKTDTDRLDCASQRDEDAHHFIHQYCDLKALSRLMKVARTTSLFRNFKAAYNNTDKSEDTDRWLVSVGMLQSEKEIDDLAFIADDFIEYKNCNQLLVCGIYGGKAVFTARSREGNEPLDPLLKKKFGEESAGGKLTPIGEGRGGGMYELDFGPFGIIINYESEEVERGLEDFVKMVFKDRWFRV